MFYVEGFDRFSYEWYLIGEFRTREEAKDCLEKKREEQEQLNGKYNPIGDVYYLRDSVMDVRADYYGEHSILKRNQK